MILSRFTKGHGSLPFLLTTLLLSFAGDARRPHDLGQGFLILGRVKGSVKRGALDLAVKPVLQFSHDRHHQVLIQHPMVHHAMLDTKPISFSNTNTVLT